jgi:nitrogen regulatory protein P-II 1
MSFMVILVVDDPDDCPAILNAWEQAGVTGVTILESSGLGRLRRYGLRDDIPLMPSLRDLFTSDEIRHRTLISVVDEQTKVDQMVEAAQAVIGDLDHPHTGFLFVVPVLQAYGLGKKLTLMT